MFQGLGVRAFGVANHLRRGAGPADCLWEARGCKGHPFAAPWSPSGTAYSLVLSREWGHGYWGLYRGYYRDPFPHSLPSIREFKDLRIRDCLFSLFVRFRSSGQPRKGKTLIRNSKTRSHSYKKHIYKKNSNNSTKSEKTIIGTSLLLLVSNHDYNKCYN